ncbi:serine hydrolase domain-containing protein [Nocardioides coralli]|uniref:serine hydrolase domain-containing protein n=1 Tax=Nocardioides coralli TaxID=2872154 RepID=UPI001CA39719|nr:serine hydrolase domain-containing protein [Nocardioides coralli]QZY30478.1 beta-lactamase family protein [Nocardioides coralli]
MIRRLVPVAAAVVALLVGCSADTTRTPSAPAGTTEEAAEVEPWPTASAASVGLDAEVLDRLARDARRRGSTCFAVVRDGRLVTEGNWREHAPDRSREVFSVTKSVAAALVGIAAREGLLELDEPAARHVPAWRGTPAAAVTVRHLLANASGREHSAESDYTELIGARDRTAYAVGLEQAYPPGTAWAYNNAAIQSLDAVLRGAVGGPVDEFARERLFEPLGMLDSRLTRDASGRSTNLFFGMQTTCRDLARFGQLFLDDGRAAGRRLLDRGFVADVARPSSRHTSAYGLLWWLNRTGTVRGALDAVDGAGQPVRVEDGQLAPGAPERLFAALGLGGQVLLVDPGTDTLVVRLGLLASERGRSYSVSDAARVVTEAVR